MRLPTKAEFEATSKAMGQILRSQLDAKDHIKLADMVGDDPGIRGLCMVESLRCCVNGVMDNTQLASAFISFYQMGIVFGIELGQRMATNDPTETANRV